MKTLHFLPALLLALPLAAAAQTKPAQTKPAQTQPATQSVTTVTEDLDPVTGKVIRRTTRTVNEPVGTATPAGTTADQAATAPATDAVASAFLNKKTAVASLTAPQLLDAYSRFIDKVRDDRHGWTPTEWAAASSVLSALNARYEQLRPTFSLDDKVTIRAQQGEFQALRLGQQVSKSVSDKL